MTFDEALKLVEEWQLFWMKQEDYESRAAIGVDANMRHHLAELISKAKENETNE